MWSYKLSPSDDGLTSPPPLTPIPSIRPRQQQQQLLQPQLHPQRNENANNAMNPTLPSPHVIPGPFPIIHPPRSLPVWKFYDPATRRYLPFARDVSLFLDAACFLRNSTTCGFIDRAAFPSTRTLFVSFPEWRLDIPQLRGRALRVPVTREVPDERMLFRVVQTDEHEYNFEVAVMAEGDEPKKGLKWMPVPEGIVDKDSWDDTELEAEDGLTKARL